VPRHSFAEYLTEIRGKRQIAAFVELRLIEARPASVYFSALHRSSKNEHDIGMAVVGAAVAVLARGAAEFGHGDDHRVFPEISEIGPESGERM